MDNHPNIVVQSCSAAIAVPPEIQRHMKVPGLHFGNPCKRTYSAVASYSTWRPTLLSMKDVYLTDPRVRFLLSLKASY